MTILALVLLAAAGVGTTAGPPRGPEGVPAFDAAAAAHSSDSAPIDAVCRADLGPSGSRAEAVRSPEYYRIDLVPTRKVPGARRANGHAAVTYAPTPFGIAITAGGTYVQDLAISVRNARPAPEGSAYVVWITTPDLDQVVRFGALDDTFEIRGRSVWNKYLVVVTLEEGAAVHGPRWTGPVVMRGMSRSGLMHTMAGHGPFEDEPCAQYGFQ